MKIFDYVALAGALILTVLSFTTAVSFRGNSLEVHIESEGSKWIYPLDQELDLDFLGPVGETLVEIADGKVRVSHSDCSEQICVQSGEIERSGQWIACMPNRVFITIKGAQKVEVDGESY